MTAGPNVIELTEYERTTLDRDALPPGVGEALWRGYGRQVNVAFPDPTTAYRWQMTPLGWVGHIPLTPEIQFVLQPKVPLSNLFRMLAHAYRLDPEWLEGLIECQSLAEFYERLALILARRVLDRSRKGLYRSYVPQTEPLPYIRGRLDVAQAVRTPGRVNHDCHFHEHTADIEDNQILVWTLRRIARSGLCSERTLPTIRRAYRALQGLVTVQPFAPEVCLNRLYHRLNNDYEPLHALCRFFLEQSGPTHALGDRAMLPFLVDMARLYELFVAAWLTAHLPDTLRLKVQERVAIGQSRQLKFDIDLVLYEANSGAAWCVLDTKYKAPVSPANDDIFQAVTYAEAKGCRQAVLVYPKPPAHPLDETIGQIRIRSLTFGLDGDLEQAGSRFLAALLTVDASRTD